MRYQDNINLEREEHYRVQVIKPGVPFKCMDEPQYYIFLQSKKTILDLPPKHWATKRHNTGLSWYISLDTLSLWPYGRAAYGQYPDDKVWYGPHATIAVFQKGAGKQGKMVTILVTILDLSLGTCHRQK